MQTLAASGYETLHGMKMLSSCRCSTGSAWASASTSALCAGAHCILVPQFNIQTYAKLLKKKKPNLIPGRPDAFRGAPARRKARKADLSFLRGVFSGGDSLSIELKGKVDKFLKEQRTPVQIREGLRDDRVRHRDCLTPMNYYREGRSVTPSRTRSTRS